MIRYYVLSKEGTDEGALSGHILSYDSVGI